MKVHHNTENTDRPAGHKRGYPQFPNMISGDINKSRGARLCYARLHSYAWQDGECWPGQQRLAADLRVTTRMVRYYIKELVDAGLIRVEHRPLYKGKNDTNKYILQDLDATDCKEPSTRGTDRKAISYPGRKSVSYNKDAVDEYTDTHPSFPSHGGTSVEPLFLFPEED